MLYAEGPRSENVTAGPARRQQAFCRLTSASLAQAEECTGEEQGLSISRDSATALLVKYFVPDWN